MTYPTAPKLISVLALVAGMQSGSYEKLFDETAANKLTAHLIRRFPRQMDICLLITSLIDNFCSTPALKLTETSAFTWN